MLKDRLKTALRPLLDAVRYLPFALGRPPSPRVATIDPISRCNLRCPLCPTGRGHASSPGKGILSRDLYLRALDQLPRLECLRLFNWGESLLHPEILDFIRIASERDIRVHVHSNLSIKKDDAFFEDSHGRDSTRSSSRSTAPPPRATRAIAWVATSIS